LTNDTLNLTISLLQADGEEIVLKANRNTPSSMLTCAIRPAGIFGEKDTTVSYKILEHGREASNTSIRMQLGDNNNLFDFTYVGNIAYAHTLAAHRLLATHARYESGQGAPLDYECVDGEAFNVTNDEPMYFWDYARALWSLTDRFVEPSQVYALPEGLLTVVGSVIEGVYSLLGKTPRLTSKAVRFSCMTRYYSCQKAKDRLGYSPIVDISEAVVRTVGFWIASGSTTKNKKLL
jgi:sterol-4alpha-carboxylate 3-dehydrogenase (decarboxylating)